VGVGVSDHKLQEKLRIVSGSAAGRKLISFRSPQTRPMMEKVSGGTGQGSVMSAQHGTALDRTCTGTEELLTTWTILVLRRTLLDGEAVRV
jgi:hypothetical protein